MTDLSNSNMLIVEGIFIALLTSCQYLSENDDQCFKFSAASICIPGLDQENYYSPEYQDIYIDSVNTTEIFYYISTGDANYKYLMNGEALALASKELCNSNSTQEFYMFHELQMSGDSRIDRVLFVDLSIKLNDSTKVKGVEYSHVETSPRGSDGITIRKRIQSFDAMELYHWAMSFRNVEIKKKNGDE